MSTKLSYSQEALSSRSIFYNQKINIFIEDEGKEYLYEEILNRLLNGKLKNLKVFGLGGKHKVLAEYIRRGEYDRDNTPNLFLVDGDFDRYINYTEVTRDKFNKSIVTEDTFVVGKFIRSNSVIYLKTYNIENYYIDENAVLKYIKGIIRKQDHELKKILNFDDWRNRIIDESKDLFIIYCFIAKYLHLNGSMINGQKSKLSIKTVSRPHFTFLDQKTGFRISIDRYENFKNEIKEYLNEENPSINLDDELSKISNKYQEVNGNDDYYNLICGKFLFSSLEKYIGNICKKSIDFKQFQWQMVLSFDITKLSYIKERVESLLVK
ncbi:MAG: DUF4435 domain-containing protein [Streptococcus sp.]|nr:DUF4435 domain-containing protein [Streptococcus sp.]